MTTETTEKPKHYKYGGSKLELLRACPGSVKASEPYADQPPGEAAERGTRIHSHMERAIQQNLTGLYMSGGAEAKEANIGILAARTIVELAKEHGYSREELTVEVQLQSSFHPEAGGTPDVDAAKPGHDLLCFDLKTGRNFVGVEENIQLLFYAVCKYDSLPALTRMLLGNMVHFYIIQPEQEPPHEVHVRKWSIPLATLVEKRQEIIDIITNAEENPDKRIPGDHCAEKWCAARRECAEYKTWLNDRTHGAFLNMLQGAAKAETLVAKGQSLADQLSVLDALKDFIKRVEEDAKLALMKDPQSVPGYGLADGYGNRTWSDEKALDALAKDHKIKADEYKPRQLISPAKFEALLKSKGLNKDLIADLTERPNTGAKLVKIKPTDLSALL